MSIVPTYKVDQTFRQNHVDWYKFLLEECRTLNWIDQQEYYFRYLLFTWIRYDSLLIDGVDKKLWLFVNRSVPGDYFFDLSRSDLLIQNSWSFPVDSILYWYSKKSKF